MTFSENCNHLPILLWVPSSQGLNQILNDSFWLWGKSFNAVRIIIQGWLLIKMCWKRSTFRRLRDLIKKIVRDLRLLKTPILPNCPAASPSANLLQQNLAKYFHLWHAGDTRIFFSFSQILNTRCPPKWKEDRSKFTIGPNHLHHYLHHHHHHHLHHSQHHHCPHLHHHGGWEEKGERR